MFVRKVHAAILRENCCGFDAHHFYRHHHQNAIPSDED